MLWTDLSPSATKSGAVIGAPRNRSRPEVAHVMPSAIPLALVLMITGLLLSDGPNTRQMYAQDAEYA